MVLYDVLTCFVVLCDMWYLDAQPSLFLLYFKVVLRDSFIRIDLKGLNDTTIHDTLYSNALFHGSRQFVTGQHNQPESSFWEASR